MTAATMIGTSNCTPIMIQVSNERNGLLAVGNAVPHVALARIRATANAHVHQRFSIRPLYTTKAEKR